MIIYRELIHTCWHLIQLDKGDSLIFQGTQSSLDHYPNKYNNLRLITSKHAIRELST